jgi:type IV secretory pathway VirB2 component (pilin)
MRLRTRTVRWPTWWVIAGTVLPAVAWAGTGGTAMPWNTPFQALLDNLSGPTARVLAGIMLVIGGAVWGFTRHEEGAKRIGQAIFGIAIMFGAVQIVAALAFAGATV